MPVRQVLVSALVFFCGAAGPNAVWASDVILGGAVQAGQFRDPGLESAVRAALGQPTGALTTTGLASLTELAAADCGIADLAGIEQLPNLTSLLLPANRLDDVGPLAALARLAILDLGRNGVTDLSPLAGSSALTHLNLEENQLADLSPLGHLAHLQVLLLDWNRVCDLTPLLALPSLSEVSVLGNPLSTAAVVEQIPALRRQGVRVHYDDRSDSTEGVSGWRSLGPETTPWNVGVFHLAAAPGDPRILYAVAQNGLWRSADQGATWDRTQLMLPGTGGAGLPEVLLGAGDPPELYWADTDPLSDAVECLRSTDNGSRWVAVATPSGSGRCDYVGPQPASPLVAADPLVPEQVYGWWCGSCMLSVDGGEAWQQVQQADGGPLYLDSGTPFLVAHPLVAGMRYAGGISVTGRTFVARSVDSGHTWDERREFRAGLTALALDPLGEGHWLALAADSVLASVDNGATWRPTGYAPEAGLLGLLAVAGNTLSDLVSGQPVWYAWWPPRDWTGDQATWRSADLGQRWERVALSGIRQLLADPFAPGELLAVVAPPDRAGGAYASADSGRTWLPLPLTERQQPAEALVLGDRGDLWVGGARWDRGLPVPALWRSDDRGGHWQEHVAPAVLERSMPGLLAGGPIDRLLVDPARPGLLWAHTGTRFLASRDSGLTWQVALDAGRDLRVQPRTHADIVRAAGIDETLYLLEPGGRLFRGDQPEGPWREINLARLGSGSQFGIGAMAWVPTSTGRLYVGKAVTGEVWWSEDGGATWTRAGRLPGGYPARALAANPASPSHLYAASALGLSLTTDAGQTWQLVLEAPNQVWPQVRFAFVAGDSQSVMLATGRRLYASRDAGATWASLGEGIAGQPWFSDVAVDPSDPTQIYAATPQGVYRLDEDAPVTVVDELPDTAPTRCSLAQNYPNPFNTQTTIIYQLPRHQQVSLVIYDILGRSVRRLVTGEQAPGEYRLVWDGRDDQEREVASGIYLCRLVTGTGNRSIRLALVR